MHDHLNSFDKLDRFHGKKVVPLVRDPRDVAVSQCFRWKYRMLPSKNLLNSDPAHGADVGVWAFVTNPKLRCAAHRRLF